MNFISIIIGVVCAIPTFLFFLIPFAGWINWLILPGAFLGALLGAFAEKKTGLVINLIVIAVGGFRLFMGGGIV